MNTENPSLQNKKSISNKWSIFTVVVTATFMSTLDSSIVNVALPVMANSLKVTTSNIQFVATIYLLVISAVILLSGKIGDMFGKGKVFKIGVILFTLGSLLCGLSKSFTMLIVSRIVQALGASCTMGVNQGIITEAFPKEERGKALGILGTVVALGMLVGPGLGGLIVGHIGWEYIFFINLPIGIADVIFCFLILPKHNRKPTGKIDLWGSLLFITFVVPLFVSLNESIKLGFSNPIILLMLAVAIASFIGFLIVESKRSDPMLDLTIFKNKLFSLSIFCGYITFVAIFCNTIILPFYLQDVRSFTPAMAGLIIMTNPIVMSVVAPLSGTLSDKIGSEMLTFIGLFVMGIGTFLLGTMSQSTHIAYIVIYIAVAALGTGLFQAPNNSLIMSTVEKTKLGIAGSINGLVRNLGMSCGIVIATTLLYSMMSIKLSRRVTDYVPGRPDVFIFGMRVVYVVAGLICMLGAALTLFRLIKARQKKA